MAGAQRKCIIIWIRKLCCIIKLGILEKNRGERGRERDGGDVCARFSCSIFKKHNRNFKTINAYKCNITVLKVSHAWNETCIQHTVCLLLVVYI